MDSSKNGFPWLEVVGVFVVIAILAAIAIPNFLKFGAKTPQSEAKTNLSSIATAEISYNAEMGKNMWGATFNEVGWAPQGSTRYVYFLGPKEYIFSPGSRDYADLGLSIPIDFSKYNCPQPGVSSAGFTAVAIGNTDSDPTLDVWFITQDKTPVNPLNDVIK